MTVLGIDQATSYTQAMVIGPGSGVPASAEAPGRTGCGDGGRAEHDSCEALVSAPLIQLMLCLAGQAAARPIEGLSGLAELVAQAPRSGGMTRTTAR